MCIVISAPKGASSWRIRRFVELIGQKRELEEFEVLFGVYAVNNEPDGQPNHFKMLHPGNVSCEEIQAWPLPRHPDEPEGGKGIFEEIYGKAFEVSGEELYQKETLTGWDSWKEIKREPVCTLKDSSNPSRVAKDFETGAPRTYVPFTSWTVGPFTIRGSHLLAFRLKLAGESYDRVLRPYGGDDFRINGPEQVYGQLKFSELTALAAEEREVWESRLSPFDHDRLSSNEGYDVLLLKTTETIDIDSLVGATEAPIQPQDADRFISAHQSFRLELVVK
jgi:hypothetical protein